MGWPFEEASWNGVTGAYHAAVGSEMTWLIISIVCCVAAMVVGAKHELDAYKRADQNGK